MGTDLSNLMAARSIMSTVRKIISTPKAGKPVGPYNQAVVVGNTVYISGTIPLHPETSLIVEGGVVAEAKQVLENLKAVVEASGSCMDNVVKCTILLEDINDWPAVNEVYATYFTKNYPTRAAYQVVKLPKGAKVEIEAIAIVGDVVDA